jgi:hypothetical protein
VPGAAITFPFTLVLTTPDAESGMSVSVPPNHARRPKNDFADETGMEATYSWMQPWTEG